MANNLRKFSNEAAYSAATLNRPAVSLIESNANVHFDPAPPYPALNGYDVAIEYVITDYTQETKLYTGAYGTYQAIDVTEMEVDGVSVTPANTYRFSSNGHHIVRYKIGNHNLYPSAFNSGTGVRPYYYAVVGSGITKVQTNVFTGFYTEDDGITLPDTALVFESATPPEFSQSTTLVERTYNIYVPSSAVDSYKSTIYPYEANLVQANPFE